MIEQELTEQLALDTKIGRAYDALVAKHVMGLPVTERPHPYVYATETAMRPYNDGHWWLKGRGKVLGQEEEVSFDWAEVPQYSTSDDAARDVVGMLHNHAVDVLIRIDRDTNVQWYCTVQNPERARVAFGHGQTLAEAVCRAAVLLAASGLFDDR